MRAFLRTYVQKRRAANEPFSGNEFNLLSIFFGAPELFTDEVIVDTMMTLLFAPIMTDKTSQTLVSHLATAPESLEKLRSEFQSTVTDELAGAKDRLRKFVTYENLQEMGYLAQVVMETLRFQTSNPTSTAATLERDSKIGKFQLKAGDVIYVNLQGLHRHRAQWQRPFEFLPERFDPASPLALARDGSKRRAMAYLPFMAGKRACFGKTVAELILKTVALYMSQYFEMELVEKVKYPDTHTLPVTQIATTYYPHVEMRLRLRA